MYNITSIGGVDELLAALGEQLAATRGRHELVVIDDRLVRAPSASC